MAVTQRERLIDGLVKLHSGEIDISCFENTPYEVQITEYKVAHLKLVKMIDNIIEEYNIGTKV